MPRLKSTPGPASHHARAGQPPLHRPVLNAAPAAFVPRTGQTRTMQPQLEPHQETSMKLYYAPGVCSLSPHIDLEEAGLKHTLVKTDIRAKKIEGGGDYTAINSLGYVPALALDDGTILTEGPAIVQYIADQAPDKKLAPAN
jgi:hypothetical protein